MPWNGGIITLMFLVALLCHLEREEVWKDSEVSGARADHVRRLLYGSPLPASYVWLVCGRQVLSAVRIPHVASAIPLPGRREHHTKCHVDPALPVQQTLLQASEGDFLTHRQPSQRHTHLLSLNTHSYCTFNAPSLLNG